MVAQVDVAPAVNGVTKANGSVKVKSRNQLRRLKHKQKKVVRQPRYLHLTLLLKRSYSK